MLEENKNIKNSIKDTSSLSLGLPYPKTNKLITALYMVTDIMDKEEPLRNKLRTLGINILSDPHSLLRPSIDKNINELLSLLDIASAIGMISEMNCNILRKEFIELKQSTNEESKQITLSEFFGEQQMENVETVPKPAFTNNKSKGHERYNVGVQKGNTLMKALKEIKMSDKSNFNVLKQQRRDEIIKIVKNKGSATITDIKNESKGVLATCGEKTLQRELVSMVGDGVLNKTGEKRWSRYFIK